MTGGKIVICKCGRVFSMADTMQLVRSQVLSHNANFCMLSRWMKVSVAVTLNPTPTLNPAAEAVAQHHTSFCAGFPTG